MHSECVCCFVYGGNFAYTTRFDPDKMDPCSLKLRHLVACMQKAYIQDQKKQLKLVSFLYEMQAHIDIYINMY